MYSNCGKIYALLLTIQSLGVGVISQTDDVSERIQCPFDDDSGSGEELLKPEESSRCIPLTRENLNRYVYPGCHSFMTRQCYLLNYTLNYEEEIVNLNGLDSILTVTSTDVVLEECKDVIRSFTCASVYPGCNPDTDMPQGVCEDECIEYLITGVCAQSILASAQLAAASSNEVPIRLLECDSPLEFVATHDDSFTNSSLDIENCIAISNYVDNPTSGENVTDSSSARFATAPVAASLGIFLGVTVASTVAVVTLLVRRDLKRRKREKYEISIERRTSLNPYHIPNSLALQLQSQASCAGEQYYHDVDNFQLTAEDISMLSEDLKNALIPFEQVTIIGDLGEGAFGMVFKGVLTKESGGHERCVNVAIKTIKNYTAYQELRGFLLESSLMCSFDHPNVLGMEGICFDVSSQSPYLILPFMTNGDLKSYLKNKRTVTTKSREDMFPLGLDHDVLLKMCYQIACGMEYLASRKLVHRDLAARNCMVDSDLQVKVADFGLTRDIYEREYYRHTSARRVPVKWMSPESLTDRISNEKTDVWSFGVTCWEVFSLGRTPYPTLSNHEVLEYLEQGLRQKKPALCRQEIYYDTYLHEDDTSLLSSIKSCVCFSRYTIILLCWKHNPENRPSFENIVEMIEELLPQKYKLPKATEVGSLESSYVEMMSRFTPMRDEAESIPAFVTPPNTPYRLSDDMYGFSQPDGSLAVSRIASVSSCQVDESIASDSEDDCGSNDQQSWVMRNLSVDTLRAQSDTLTPALPFVDTESHLGSMEYLTAPSQSPNVLHSDPVLSEVNIFTISANDASSMEMNPAVLDL